MSEGEQNVTSICFALVFLGQDDSRRQSSSRLRQRLFCMPMDRLAWFIGVQLLILGALCCFTRVDWKVLFDNRKLVWLSNI